MAKKVEVQSEEQVVLKEPVEDQKKAPLTEEFIYFKKIDQRAVFPERKSSRAAAFDLAVCDDYYIEPGTSVYMSTGLAVKMPEGYCGFLAARSSAFKKYGITIGQGFGLIDNDYCGDGDELIIPVFKQDVKRIGYKVRPKDLPTMRSEAEFVINEATNETKRVNMYWSRQSSQATYIPQGTRIAQLIVLPYSDLSSKLVSTLGFDNRGGFGSTGEK